MHRWILRLSEFAFVAKYFPGESNIAADYLSRTPVPDTPAVVILRHPRQMPPAMMVIAAYRSDLDERYHPNNDDPEAERTEAPPPLRRSRRIRAQKQTGIQSNHSAAVEAALIPDLIPEQQLQTVTDPMTYDLRLTAQEIAQYQRADPYIAIIADALIDSSSSVDDLPRYLRTLYRAKRFTLRRKCVVMDGERWMLPPTLRQRVLEYSHTAGMMGHHSRDGMLAELRPKYFWPDMRNQITAFVASCHSCQITKASRSVPLPPMQTFPVHSVNECVAVDLVGPMPVTKGEHQYILTMIDRFSRFVQAIPIRRCDAYTVALQFFNQWICRWGAPQSVLSDRGGQFIGNVARLLNSVCGIKQLFTTAYHPQCNGMIERFHAYMKDRLVIIALERGLNYYEGSSWDLLLPSICMAFNCAQKRSTGYAPYMLMTGRIPRRPIDIALQLNTVDG
ncbi:MAG: DDE-type integrase/transposase/recombinase [Fuerstiella sp.]|nr:DDE-type integrase/transposase/recombinase [Fuerstiella sp.]